MEEEISEIGETLGIYRIEGQLALGGMGRIYRAFDPRLGRNVAVKVLLKDAASPTVRRRFAREARAIAALSHPNILVIHDVGEEDDLLYVVTELLEGMTLAERIDRGRLVWIEAARIGHAIASGLAAAHAEELVHRDLKPENVFLTHDRRIKILDFGLAVFSPDRTSEPEESTTHKAPMAGSSGYMAPEQITGKKVDARSDLFSFGCVVYEMLAGQRAFAAKTLMGTLHRALREEPTPLGEIDSEIPQEIIAIVSRCMRKAPGGRPSSAGEVAAALNALIAEGEASAPQAPLWRRAWRRIERWRHPEGGIRSLAVLPLVNTTSHVDVEYLSDGLAEALIQKLSRQESLRLVGWGVTARFKLSGKEPAEIGRELDADGVLTGRLVRLEGRLRVTVELLESHTGDHLWGETYDQEMGDVMAIQEELAQCISEDFIRRHEAPERRPPAETTTTEAFALYLRGRYFWNQRTRESLERSKYYFEKSMAADPSFPQPHVGLADVYNVMPFWGLSNPRESYPKAEAQARLALDLAGDCAEAFASLAYFHFFFAWDYLAAKEAFKKSLSLEPGYATAHHWYGVAAALCQDTETAARQLDKAHELDPVSLIINADRALVSFLAGDYEHAVHQCRAALELGPAFGASHLYHGLALEACARHEEAASALEKAVKATDRAGPPLAALAHCYAVIGRSYTAKELLAELATTAETSYVSAYHVAVILAGLGEHEEALTWLAQAAEDRSEMFVWLPADPRLAELRTDAKCVELLKLLEKAPPP